MARTSSILENRVTKSHFLNEYRCSIISYNIQGVIERVISNQPRAYYWHGCKNCSPNLRKTCQNKSHWINQLISSMFVFNLHQSAQVRNFQLKLSDLADYKMFVNALFFFISSYFWISSARTGLLPTRPFLFTFHITLMSLFHGCRCLRDFLYFSLHCKKATSFSVRADWGNFSFPSILCQIKQWHMIQSYKKF